MSMYDNGDKPTEEFQCLHCGNGAVEFKVSLTYTTNTDNMGQPVSLGRAVKPQRRVTCSQCSTPARIVVLDPHNVAMQDRMLKDDEFTPQTVNERVVREEDARRKPIRMNPDEPTYVNRAGTKYKKFDGSF